MRTISPECGAACTLENSAPAFLAAQISEVPPVSAKCDPITPGPPSPRAVTVAKGSRMALFPFPEYEKQSEEISAADYLQGTITRRTGDNLNDQFHNKFKQTILCLLIS